MLLNRIRKSRAAKIIALTLVLQITFQWFSPTRAFALTTGPSQPEMQSFEPVGTSDQVDVFSGDYNYNIPLLDVDGYPVNISYNSGITMDQEASWVGLGWNINPGAVNRNMRGIPDDFNGDKITKRSNLKPNRTYGVSVGFGAEAFGIDALGLNYSISANYNNYKGVGFEQSLNMQFSAGKAGKGELTGGLGITSGGDGLTPSLSFSANSKKLDNSDTKIGGSIGLSFNSRAGLKNLSLSCSVTESANKSTVANGHIKHDAYTSSLNGGANINFAGVTYTPQITMPMTNTSFAVSIKAGVTLFGVDGTGNLSGYYSEQRLERQQEQIPAFGYMNSQTGISYDRAIHDVNREKETGFTENTPALPITNYSYDVYTVNGQGVGGNYRPFRSDLGTIYDPAASTNSLSGNLGVELAGGNLLHNGADVTITDVKTTSGKWSGDDNTSAALKFRSSVSGNPLFEPWYFKQAGETSVDSDTSLFNTVGASDPVSVNLVDGGGTNVSSGTSLKRQHANSTTNSISIPGANYRASRQKRNQPISYLTFAQAADALEPSILTHSHATMAAYYPATTEEQQMQLHHIGEISVLRSDGARYVYGLPAYNIRQQEVSFNVQGRTYNCGTGIVTYNEGDNGTGNSLGIDNYYSMTETPAFSHSHLLTAIISPDYVDYDAVEGPSKGDLGTYTKFSYVKSAASFKWRTPYGNHTANMNEGQKSDPADDKGNYVYGEKEAWYLNTIETKNYIAVFTLSNREDGFGVKDSTGIIDTSAHLKKLDRIDLYSKPDYDANGASATPIKSVYFEYNYSLCPGTPNRYPATSGGYSGKLTLTKIYFTYGKSYKAKLSAYNFTYADLDHDGTPDVNYGYNVKGYDRWGGYKPNVTSSTCGGTDSLSNAEYPYTQQDSQTNADHYSAAWNLTSISLPSGGVMKIDYESDDYAYVQDRKAAQMFKVSDVYIYDGTGTTPTNMTGVAGSGSPTRVALMTSGNYSGKSYYVYFKLATPILTSTSSTVIRNTLLNDYLGNQLSNIYFRFFADVTNNNDYEYVSGYFDVDDASSQGVGVAGSSGGYYNYGWLRVKKAPIGDRDNPNTECNPISKATWQYGRMNLPRKVWNQPDPQANGVEQTLRAIANSSFFGNILQTFKGPNKTIRDEGYGLNAVTQKSWIRMNNPGGKKFGGGSRVKKITISDNWKSMTNNSGYTPNDAQYGQQYTYTIVENGRTISSGVASYEPQIGGDENPFRQPVFFKEEKRLVPDDESYMEEPFGEMFFPAPGVGYSHVEVRNLQYSNVKRHATGYTVQEFYTAKDFPTITRHTDMDLKHKRTNPILSLLKIKMKDYVTASQGYVVELNNMHGKPKAQYVYAEDQVAPISEVHYFYKTNAINKKQLENRVYSVNKDGTVSNSIIGLDCDFVNDMREQQTKVISGGLSLNLAGFLAAIFPCVVPTILPSWNQEDTRFRSDVVTKVINRYGILERTEAHDAGSTITTENLAWDAESGSLLLTKTKNDFDDPVYNFTYPAHWGYDHMGQAYKNLLVGFTGQTITSGVLTTVSSPANYFTPGDEVSVTISSGTHYKAWVCSINGSNVNLIDKTGSALSLTNSTCTVIVTRSGRRNQQDLAIGGITMLTNPLKDNNNDGKYDTFAYDTTDKILTAKAQEYSDRWMMWGGYVSPSNTACSCEKSTIYGQVWSFLATLQSDGKLLTSGEKVYDSGSSTYYHAFSSILKDSLSASGNIYWYPTVSGQILTGLVSNSSTNYSAGCTVTIQLPTPYTFSQISTINVLEYNYHPGACSGGRSFDFVFDFTMVNGQHVTGTGTNTKWDMENTCTTSGSPTTCGKLKGDIVNPYYEDILGVWRPVRSHLYLASRSQSTASNNTDVRKDGYMLTNSQTTGADTTFQPFWRVNSGNDWTKDPTYWTWSSEVTKYTPFGNEVENRDALNRYSAAVFGYRSTLPIAVASNAQYQEIAYDGFEDYAFIDSTDCRRLHFNFYESRSKKSATEAHTGLYSLKLTTADSATADRPLTNFQPLPGTATCSFVLSNGDFVGTFSPITYNGTKKYVLSYWVKETGLTQPVFDYPDAIVKIKFLDPLGNVSYAPLTLVQKSDIIEGWQQYQYTFDIAANLAGSINVVLKNTHAAPIICYFDDIRLHPFDSNMKSYVYNPINLRLTAELDENNYASLYDYDSEGQLARVKKETASGIMTIKESRNNTAH